MAYSTDILDTRVTILNRTASTETALGKKSGTYEPVGTVWASWTQTKGARAMHEGALDAYSVGMLRMRYTPLVLTDSRFTINGVTYQQEGVPVIKKRANEIQTILRAVK